MISARFAAVWVLLGIWATALPAQEKLPGFTPQPCAPGAAKYGKTAEPAAETAKGMFHLEAEEFVPQHGIWQARDYGTNFYVSTFAVTFLSRKAYLAAPPDAQAIATRKIRVTTSGRYLVLARYEAAYRFHTQFRIEIEQGGRTVFRRLYGSLGNLRIWPFGKKLQKDLTWPWGANEQIVWEGHDAEVALRPGPATIRLVAVKQPGPRTWRHVDCLLLTTDKADVQMRINKERYLPLDGLLTQSGDVWAKITNHSPAPLQATLPKCIEHSPYWVHLRTWKPRIVNVPPGRSSDWIEVGSLLDCFNDCVWRPAFRSVKSSPNYTFMLAVREPKGKKREVFRHRGSQGQLSLYVDGAMRYSPRVQHTEAALPELLQYLERKAAAAKLPQTHTLNVPIYCLTFQRRKNDANYNRLVDRWLDLFPLAPTDLSRPGTNRRPRGYIDVRGIPTARLEAYCQKLKADGLADRILVVSLGDEIALPPVRSSHNEAFRAWLMRRRLKPADVVPGADSWQQVNFAPAPDPKKEPRRYYYTHRFQQDYGIQAIKKRTDILRRYLPNAGIGANYSPHHGYHYLGKVHQWVDVFRKEGMTLPWSEDYIWQTPVASQQVNSLGLDLFRAGLRGKRDQKILYYVMPHWPGNTPESWRRLFFACLGHGMKIANLFEFRPLPVAYTENYVNHPRTYWEVLRTSRELARFDDIVADGRVLPGNVGLWFSKTADIWHDHEPPYGAEKRTLYVALRQLQLPVEVVTEGDALAGKLQPYRVIYLQDQHVHRSAAEALFRWVQGGGKLFLSAGAATRDQFDSPLEVLYRPLGLMSPELLHDDKTSIHFVKEDLPFASPLAEVCRVESPETYPAFGLIARLKPEKSCEVLRRFSDGTVAACRVAVGKGWIYYCSFLPALSAVRPSIKQLPITRGGTMASPSHFAPIHWQRDAMELLRAPTADVRLAVEAAPGHVETCWIDSPHGAALVLVGWDDRPVAATVTIRRAVPTRAVTTASGTPVSVVRRPDGTLRVSLIVRYGDAVVFRK